MNPVGSGGWLGLLWLLLANAASLLGARALLEHVRTGDRPVDLVLFLLLRLLLVSGAVLVAGLAGWLSPLGLGLPCTLVLVGLIASGAHRGLHVPRLPRVSLVLWILSALLVARLLLQVWAFVPYLNDVLAYHVPKIAEWIRAQGFTREMGLDSHVYFPAGFELVETWWVVFLRHDVVIELAGLEFLALAFASTYALGRKLDLAQSTSFLAALLFVTIPAIHLQATACLNDGVLAALVTSTSALIVGRAPLASLALAIGLGAGVKGTYLYAFPGLVLLFVLLGRGPRSRARSPRSLWALGALALAVGGFWYLRNAIQFENPVYPVVPGGLRDETGFLWIQAGPSLASLRDNLAAFLDSRIYDREFPYGALNTRIAGWGYVAFACGLLGLPVLARENARYRKLLLCYALSACVVLLSVKHDDWYMRFVLFFPAVLVLGAARLVEASRLSVLVLAPALLMQLAATTFPPELPPSYALDLWRQGWKERSIADAELRGITEPVVGCWGGYAEPYLLYRPDYSRRVVYLRSPTAADLFEDMKRAELRLLYAVPWTPAQQQVLDDGMAKGYLRRVGELLYVRP